MGLLHFRNQVGVSQANLMPLCLQTDTANMTASACGIESESLRHNQTPFLVAQGVVIRQRESVRSEMELTGLRNK